MNRRPDDLDGIELNRIFAGVDINRIKKTWRLHKRYPILLRLFEMVADDMKRAWIKSDKKETFSKELLESEVRYIMKIRNPDLYVPFGKDHLPIFMLMLFYYKPSVTDVFDFKVPVHMANDKMKKKLGL